MFRIKAIALSFVLVTAVAATAHASSIGYTVDVGAGAINGNALTNVAIFETNGTLTTIDFGYTLNAFGQTTLTHDAAFAPTSSLIVGIDLPGAIGDGKTHVVFFTNTAFAQSANGLLFSVVFPNTHHNDFIARLLAAEGGDTVNQAWLRDFFATGDGAAAAFSPGSATIGVEFTGAYLLTPEPSTFVLLGLGAALAAARRLKRART